MLSAIFIEVLSNAAFLSVAAAIISALISNAYMQHAQKRQLVLSLTESYLDLSRERAHAQWVFQTCAEENNCKHIFPADDATESEYDESTHNRYNFYRLGDWYEILAALYLSDALDKPLFEKSGLKSKMTEFLDELMKIPLEDTEIFRKSWPRLYDTQDNRKC